MNSTELTTPFRAASFFRRAEPQAPARDAEQILAVVLGIDASTGPLSLRDRFASLPAVEQENVRRLWGEARLDQIFSLAQETDPEMLLEGMLHFGRALQEEDRLEPAARVFSAAREYSSSRPEAFATGLSARAQDELQVLSGGGPSGLRAEFVLSRFARQTLEPSSLLAMGIASAAFKVTRLAALSRLTSGAPGIFTQGFGARALSSLLAFGIEAPTFALSSKVLSGALGGTQDWSAQALRREIFSSYLVLGGLKLAAWGGGELFNRVHGLDALTGGATRLTGFTRASQILLPQLSMLGGIYLGHALEARAGLREVPQGANRLFESLTTLLQFNIAGNLTRGLFGPNFAAWEDSLERRSDWLARERPFVSPQQWLENFGISALRPRFAHVGPEPAEDFSAPMLMAAMLPESERGGGRGSPPLSLPSGKNTLLPLPRMGLFPAGDSMDSVGVFRQVEAASRLQRLMPSGRIDPAHLEEPHFIAELLSCFGVSSHALDQQSFRNGFDIAQKSPERVRSLAFDIDEVYLHWSLNLPDLFRGIFERGRDALYQHTSQDLFKYEPFQVAPNVKLRWYERLWFNGVQSLLGGRMRQTIQLHPGVRAFQLGLRMGQDQDLIMATTGPAGRILILANEDPAMRMIYFGKGPNETVDIEEIRSRGNIYTREHLVLAMREILSGENQYPFDPQVRDYVERIGRHPEKGAKFKHPAIATLLGKRPFTTLVDDSESTYRMLGDVPGFSILKPPSARPSLTLNFVLAATGRYLRRMSNAYVQSLSEILGGKTVQSQEILATRSTPGDYPHQRFALEIPWSRHAREFVEPARELKLLARQIGTLHLTDPSDRFLDPLGLEMADGPLRAMTGRLQQELDLWTEGADAQGQVRAWRASDLRDMAKRNDQDLRNYLATYLSDQEMEFLLPADRSFLDRPPKFFSRIAGVLAAKQAALDLLGLPLGPLARDLEFRFGRPQVREKLQEKLGSKNLIMSMTSDGNIALGVAMVESSNWMSGITRLGIDLTTSRVQYTRPELHALAESAHKAVYQGYPNEAPKTFNHHRTRELQQGEDGQFSITGRMAAAARALLSEKETTDPLAVRALHFRNGRATVALLGIPGPRVPSFIRPGEEPFSPTSTTSEILPSGRSEASPLSSAPARIDEVAQPSPENTKSNDVAREPALIGRWGDDGNGIFYRTRDDGTFIPPLGPLRIAVLGDRGGLRTGDLVAHGHRIVHIERDAELLQDSFEHVQVKGNPTRVDFVLGDWYRTGAQADWIEAFFPLDGQDLPQEGRTQVLRNFFNKALLSKLDSRARGGFVLSDRWELIEDLARVIEDEPHWKIAGMGIEENNPAIHVNPAQAAGPVKYSWLVFRPENDEELGEFLPPPALSMESKAQERIIFPLREIPVAIQSLIREIPSGPPMNPSESDSRRGLEGSFAHFRQGTLRHRRLEALHQILGRGRDISDLHAIDNGPGPSPEVAIALARLGSRVTVKEPGWWLRANQRYSRLHFSEYLDRITYVEPEDVHEVTPADIVYWTNPNAEKIVFPPGISLDAGLEEYLARDVKPGGFLVIQSDHHFGKQDRLLRLDFDPQAWKNVFHQHLEFNADRPNYVLPSPQVDFHLQIFHRK